MPCMNTAGLSPPLFRRGAQPRWLPAPVRYHSSCGIGCIWALVDSQRRKMQPSPQTGTPLCLTQVPEFTGHYSSVPPGPRTDSLSLV